MKPSPMDWRDPVVLRGQAMRDLDAYSWAPRPFIYWPTLRGAFVTLVIACFLLGLLAVGSK